MDRFLGGPQTKERDTSPDYSDWEQDITPGRDRPDIRESLPRAASESAIATGGPRFRRECAGEIDGSPANHEKESARRLRSDARRSRWMRLPDRKPLRKMAVCFPI